MSLSKGEDLGADLDDLVPLATDDAVNSALAGFVLPLRSEVSPAWLGKAVRRALAVARPDPTRNSRRPGNSAIQKELARGAETMEATANDLFSLSWWSDNELWIAALEEADGDAGIDLGEFGIISQPVNYRRLKAVIDELDGLAAWMRYVSARVPEQRGPWQRSAERAVRVERGYCLAPIYEIAFGESVSANNWPSEPRLQKPTPFMEFYQRIVRLAYNEQATPDLPGVVKEACRRHRKNPVSFGPGIIPAF